MSASTPPKANPNSGMLEGMRCPNCSSFEPFHIVECNVIEVYDEGFGRDLPLGWDDDSSCRCGKCNFEGIVRDFKADASGA
jgi:hypothetical protein